MKAFQIEDAKTRFFKTKEDYLKFKQAWKDFHNNQPLVEWKDKDISPWNRAQTLDPILARTKYPVLSSAHYMLYNLVRGYDIKHGYSPLTNEGRLNANLLDGAQPWRNCEAAASEICSAAKVLRNVNKSLVGREYSRKEVERMLLPFGGTVTHQMLYDLAAELYLSMTEQEFPAFEVEEWREPEPLPPVKQSIADKLKAWRAV